MFNPRNIYTLYQYQVLCLLIEDKNVYKIKQIQAAKNIRLKISSLKNIESNLWLRSVVSLEIKVDVFLAREERTPATVEMFVTVDYLLTDPAHAFATVGAVNFVATVSEK